MEEKSPTMPGVFNRFLNIIGRHATCREVIYDVTLKNDQSSLCPHCGAASYAHGYRRRLVDFMNDEGAVRRCRIKVRRFKCRSCQRTWSQDLRCAGIRPYARRNELLERSMGELLERSMGRQMMQGVCNKHIAANFKVNPSTVERCLQRLFALHLRERLNYPCPVYLGIDEHSIHKGRRYAVSLVDLI